MVRKALKGGWRNSLQQLWLGTSAGGGGKNGILERGARCPNRTSLLQTLLIMTRANRHRPPPPETLPCRPLLPDPCTLVSACSRGLRTHSSLTARPVHALRSNVLSSTNHTFVNQNLRTMGAATRDLLPARTQPRGVFNRFGSCGCSTVLGDVGGVWNKASVLGCLPLAAPIGLSPLLILTLCGSKRVLVVSTEPLDDLSCLTTPGSAVLETGCCPCH